MRRRGVLALVAALVLLVTTIPSEAHLSGCSGSWRKRTYCTFGFRGLPVSVFGYAETTSGTARIRVWITIQDPTAHRTVLECEDEGYRYATCTAEIGVGEEVDLIASLVPMTCRVEGIGPGRYACGSA